MKREVITHNEIEGFHYYPDAPDFCAYLGNKHRHVFVVRCHFEVSHNEREIEIIDRQREIAERVARQFGSPADFGGFSCEDIAEWLMVEFEDMVYCKVLEDGYGGAALSR